MASSQQIALSYSHILHLEKKEKKKRRETLSLSVFSLSLSWHWFLAGTRVVSRCCTAIVSSGQGRSISHVPPVWVLAVILRDRMRMLGPRGSPFHAGPTTRCSIILILHQSYSPKYFWCCRRRLWLPRFMRVPLHILVPISWCLCIYPPFFDTS